ncbi:MAG: AmmeMemoRadiSam system protein B [Candidatus Omnitrophota bacterium]
MRILFVAALIFLGLTMNHSFSFAQEDIQSAALAGEWYPAVKTDLSALLDGFFADVPSSAGMPSAGDIGVIISPHAGYPFSGRVAACGFKAAEAKKIATVIILAPTHHFSFKGASVWAKGSFTTPLGTVAVDEDFAARLLAADTVFTFRKDVFKGVPGRPENSVETQIPFIQRTFPGAKIVPVIVGYPPDPAGAIAIARALAAVAGAREDVLVVVSVDQSHFHPLKEAEMIDRAGLEAIEKGDMNALWAGHAAGRMEVDGFHVVGAAMAYAKALGYGRAKVLKYATSADVTKDVKSVVGYAAVVFYREHVALVKDEGALTAAQKDRLLSIARGALDTFVRTGQKAAADEKDPRLAVPEGAFVTLKKAGVLRGCIGQIVGEGPLAVTVRDMAVAAASQDPRFEPVAVQELSEISLEVSVLSAPCLIKDVGEIVMGKHGVIVSRGSRGGVFLPQVATETGWSRERFLSELCSQKAGLSPDCWKDPQTKIEIFTADVFGEKKE